jgi:hypothetical protein
MFNLLVFNVDWSQGKASVPLARIFEHTESYLKEQFRDQGGNLLIDRLIELPCIFCQEGTDDEIVYVGQINRARYTGKDLYLEFSIDHDVPPLQNSIIYNNHIELDIIDTFEFSRNHWAIKNVDLYRFLLRNVRPRRQPPTVFKIQEHDNIQQNLVSVMMPFSMNFDSVYTSIKNAAQNAGLICKRAVDIWENTTIIQDIVSLIDRSRIVVCDCTGRNSNVFYEAGIAHALGREVILITQHKDDVPFDLHHIRHVLYLNNSEGLEKLSRNLQSRIESILGH